MDLALALDELLPDTPEKERAIGAIDDACKHANGAIARSPARAPLLGGLRERRYATDEVVSGSGDPSGRLNTVNAPRWWPTNPPPDDDRAAGVREPRDPRPTPLGPGAATTTTSNGVTVTVHFDHGELLRSQTAAAQRTRMRNNTVRT